MVQDKHIFIYTDSWDTKIEWDAIWWNCVFLFRNLLFNECFLNIFFLVVFQSVSKLNIREDDNNWGLIPKSPADLSSYLLLISSCSSLLPLFVLTNWILGCGAQCRNHSQILKYQRIKDNKHSPCLVRLYSVPTSRH